MQLKSDTEIELDEILQETLGEYPFIMYKAEKVSLNIDQEKFTLSVYHNEKLVIIKIYKENFRWYINIDEDNYEIFHQHNETAIWKAITLSLFQQK